VWCGARAKHTHTHKHTYTYTHTLHTRPPTRPPTHYTRLNRAARHISGQSEEIRNQHGIQAKSDLLSSSISVCRAYS
jgi:hypothetical protein